MAFIGTSLGGGGGSTFDLKVFDLKVIEVNQIFKFYVKVFQVLIS